MPWWDCNSAAALPPVPYTGPLTDAARWVILYSPGMPTQPAARGDGGFTLPIPLLPASLHMVVAQVDRPLAPAVRMRIGFELSPDAVLTARLPDGSSPDDGVPGVRLYVERRAEDRAAMMTGDGDYQFFRWWSPRIDVANGAFDLEAPTDDPAQWISVWGRGGDEAPALFKAAMADCHFVGMTFGGWFAGHGIACKVGGGQVIVSSYAA